jgi:hypothetical protein
MFTKTSEGVRVDLTRDEFDKLLVALGIATGALSRIGDTIWLVKLINAVNDGNPDFVPYEVNE